MKEGQSAAKLLNEKYKGKNYGVLTVIEFSHRNGTKYFYKCLCNRCDSTTIARIGRGNYTPKSCNNCVNDLCNCNYGIIIQRIYWIFNFYNQ